MKHRKLYATILGHIRDKRPHDAKDSLAKWLRALRGDRQVKVVAKGIGCSSSTICSLEAGQDFCYPDIAIRLGEFYGIGRRFLTLIERIKEMMPKKPPRTRASTEPTTEELESTIAEQMQHLPFWWGRESARAAIEPGERVRDVGRNRDQEMGLAPVASRPRHRIRKSIES